MTIRLLRATLVALGALLLTTCSDAPNTAGRRRVASLAVSPVLAAGQSSAGLVIDQVRLVVKRPGSTTAALLDKLYPFPATQNELTISDSVEVDSDPERLEVTLTLLNGATALFSGTATRDVPATGGTPFEVPVHYVGPGAEITTLSLAPRDTQLTFGDALEYRVAATDAQQRPVTQYYLTWSSSNVAQTPSASGVLRAGNARAVLQISAQTPGGVLGATSVTIVPPPSRVVKIAGDNQSALVSTLLAQALEVEVQGADNLPVPGVRVNFAPSGPGGGSVENALVITDQNGRARTRATLGAALGRQDFNATVGSVGTATFSATATPIVPVVSFANASQTVSEGVGTATIAVQLSAATSVPVTVPFTLSGTAASPADYTVPAGPLVIPAGSTSGSVTVTVINDAVAEPDETVIVTLGAPINGTLGATTVHTLTIAGQTPTVSWGAASQSANEGASATITAQLSSASTQAVTIPFTVSGSASGADYTITASPLVIPAGSTSATATVNVVNDAIAEADETLIVTMAAPTNATLGATPVHTLTIVGQVPTVSWTAASQTVAENVGTTTITARLSSASTQPVTVPFTVTGTAGSPADYTITASPLTIPAGSTSASITLNLVADGIAEPNETVIVTMGTPTNASSVAPTTHTLTIAAQTPNVSWTAATQAATEGSTATITAQLSSPSTQLVTVPFTIGGTASNPADYTITASPITIPAGATSASITVTVATDQVAETDETVVVTMGTPTNANSAAPTVHTLTITGQSPIVNWSAASQTSNEGTSATITAQLSSPSTQDVMVPFSVTGSATVGSDYTISASPLVIAAGATSASITVNVLADGVAEPNETVVVTMGIPANATSVAPTVHTLTIASQTPNVSWTATSQTAGEGTAATITAQLSSPSTLPVTVPYTVTGSASNPADYTIAASPLVIQPGSTTGTVSVVIATDQVAEPNETVILTMGATTNANAVAPTAHTLTIAGQTPNVNWSAASQTTSEVGTATITAQLSSPSTQDVTVPFTVGGSATQGSDYTITASPLVISAGSTTASITVNIATDGTAEPNETVVVTMGTPTNATAVAPTTHTLTIAGQTPNVNWTVAGQAVGEGGTATITARLSIPSTQAVSIPFSVAGSATATSDYTIASTSPLTIPAGSTSASITVNAVVDQIAEPDETVIVTMGTPTNATAIAPSVHTVTITGQSPTVEWVDISQTVSETVGSRLIAVVLSSASTQDVTIPFTVGGTATSGTDYTISASPMVIPAGSTTAAVTVNVVNDAIAEPDETVIVTMGTPINATLLPPAAHILTIAAQTPTVSWNSTGQTVGENVGTATITAQLSSQSTQAVTVPFTVGTNSTASTPSDYTIATTSPLTIPAGSTTASITVNIVLDGTAEPNETIVVNMGTPTNAGQGAITIHTITIVGQTPTVGWIDAHSTVNENIGTVRMAVILSSPSSQTVTVPFTVNANSTASSPEDYTISASPLTIPPGQTTAEVVVTLVNDGLAEPDEALIITLGTPTNATLLPPSSFNLTITGQAPTVSWSVASQNANEGATATITAQLSSASSLPVSVPYSVSATSTASANDYTIPAGPLTIPANTTSASFTVSIATDGTAEPDETIVVTMGTPTNATLGAVTTHTITIPVQTPTVRWSVANQNANEGAAATITAQLSSPSSLPVTVPYSVSATSTASANDYTIPASPLTIPPGSTTASITINIVADATAEPNETIVVNMGTPTNATAAAPTTHTVTIAGQLPSARWSVSSQTVGEAAGLVTVTALLSSPSTQVISIPYSTSGTATNGVDYAIAASPLVIQPGNTSGSFNVNIVNDTSAEVTESIILTMGTPANATLGTPAQQTISIQDNEASLSIGFVGRGLGTVTSTGATPPINCATSPPPFQCSGTYPIGTNVSLTATPLPVADGIFRFEEWTGTPIALACGASPTCVVPMSQSRTAIARFSTRGTLSLNPSSTTFNMTAGGTLPPPQQISVTNVGERPVQLSSSLHISYNPSVTPWLDAQIDRQTIDTLSPATLTVSVLPNSLPGGTYQAQVLILDSGSQFSWTLNVTLVVAAGPTGPSISNITITLIQLNDAQRCTLISPPASSFRVEFDYSDPNGNGPLSISQAALNINWLFTPLNDTGGFTSYTFQSSLTGNGTTGHAITTQCWRWGSNTLLTATMSIVDQGGLRGPNAQYTLTRPPGGN